MSHLRKFSVRQYLKLNGTDEYVSIKSVVAVRPDNRVELRGGTVVQLVSKDYREARKFLYHLPGGWPAQTGQLDATLSISDQGQGPDGRQRGGVTPIRRVTAWLKQLRA